MTSDNVKKSVSYKVLVKSGNTYYKIGTMVIKTFTGDIFYTPSDNFTENQYTLEKKEIDHISWHINGQVHIKRRNQEIMYDIVQKNGERQKLSEMGFQVMLIDTIRDYKKLTIHKKKVVDLDVVFEAKKQIGQICFVFKIVSGKLLAARHRGKKVPIREVNMKSNDNIIAVSNRALGWHCGHGDVMLHYSLERSNDKIRTNRKIFIPHDMEISKSKYE